MEESLKLLYSGHFSVENAGTPQRLSEVDFWCKEIGISADGTNASWIKVGTSDISTSGVGIPLLKYDFRSLPCRNLHDVWADAAASGYGAAYDVFG